MHWVYIKTWKLYVFRITNKMQQTKNGNLVIVTVLKCLKGYRDNYHSYYPNPAISKIAGGATRCLLGRTSWNILGEACVTTGNYLV